MFGVLDRQRMQLEDLAQDLEVRCCRLGEIEPEEAAACKQLRGRLAAELHFSATPVVADLADRRACPRQRSPTPVRWCARGRRFARLTRRVLSQGRKQAGPNR